MMFMFHRILTITISSASYNGPTNLGLKFKFASNYSLVLYFPTISCKFIQIDSISPHKNP